MKNFITIIFLSCVVCFAKAQTISFGFTRTATATTQTLTLNATASANISNNTFNTGRLSLRMPIAAISGGSTYTSSYSQGGVDPNFTSVSFGSQTGIAHWYDFSQNVFTLSGLTGITTFLPSDFGDPDDGYIYMFFSFTLGNGSMTAGTAVPVLQFTVPASWDCHTGGGVAPCFQILDPSFNSVPWISTVIGQADLNIQQAGVCGGSCNLATYGTNGLLPVKLSSFSAQTTDCSNKLQWVADAETGLDHYEIQYSTDATNFTTVGKVNGKGDGSSYSFTHSLPAQGIGYYRLAIINNVGTIEYSATAKVKVNCTGSSKLAVIAPNPAQAQQGININLLGYTGVTYAALYTIDGKLISKTKLVNGNGSNKLDATGLAAGTYLVSITDSDGNTTTQKVNVSR